MMLPMFPTVDGVEIDKIAAVGTIIELARRCGEQTTDTNGGNLYGGHSLRTGGAVYLSSLGLDAPKIEAMARWASPMLLRYARNAPLKSITADFRAKQAASGQPALQAGLNEEMVKLKEALQQVREKLSEVTASELRWSSRVRELEDQNLPARYVVNTASGIWHETFESMQTQSPQFWRTKCGWEYAQSNHSTSGQLPESVSWSHICGKCMPATRLALRNAAESTGS